MTYRPVEEFFGPPLSVRLPAFIHAGVAVCVVALVLIVERGSRDSSLYHYMFRQAHYVDTHLAAGLFALSSVMSMMRDSMRGVRIRPNFLEYREIVNAVWPRVRKYRWAQIDRVIFEESGSISLDLWDGRREILPLVSNTNELRAVLERLALARAIPVIGGVGWDEVSAADEPPED